MRQGGGDGEEEGGKGEKGGQEGQDCIGMAVPLPPPPYPPISAKVSFSGDS